MRAVDSPYLPGNWSARISRLGYWHPNSRVFRSSPRYKQEEPYVYEGYPWREDVLDYQVVRPPLLR